MRFKNERVKDDLEGVLREIAKALGISRRALIYKLQRFRELGYEVDPA